MTTHITPYPSTSLHITTHLCTSRHSFVTLDLFLDSSCLPCFPSCPVSPPSVLFAVLGDVCGRPFCVHLWFSLAHFLTLRNQPASEESHLPRTASLDYHQMSPLTQHQIGLVDNNDHYLTRSSPSTASPHRNLPRCSWRKR